MPDSILRAVLLRAVGLGLLAATALAGGVRIVEPSGTLSFADVASAVAAASEGDAILVGAGTYPGFAVSGKSVSIFAVPPGSVVIEHAVSVSGLGADQTVVLQGLRILDANVLSAPSTEPALSIQSCAGNVRVEDCEIRRIEFPWALFCNEAHAGGAGVSIASSGRVALARCQILGGDGTSMDDQSDCCALLDLARGGHGIEATGSALALDDCQVDGGKGGSTECPPGRGGAGLSASDSAVFATSTAIVGGPGGDSFQLPPGSGSPGPPGAGVRFAGASSVTVVDCTVQGGPPNGPASEGGAPVALPGPARVASLLPAAGGDGGSASLAYQGVAGDRVWHFASRRPGFLFVPARHGTWLLRRSELESPVFAGIAAVDGSLDATIAEPDLAPGPSDPIHAIRFTQTVSQSAAIALPQQGLLPRFDRIASPSTLLRIDRDSGPDCDGNGVNDFVQVIEDPGGDANGNLVPDVCPGG